MSIRQANRRVIEEELRHFHRSWALVQEELRDIYETVQCGSSWPKIEMNQDGELEFAVQSGGGHSDPTYKGVIKVFDRKHYANKTVLSFASMVRLTAIKEALEEIESKWPEKYSMIELYYFERKYTIIGVAEVLHVDESTIRRWRKHVLSLIGEYLGIDV